MLDRVDQSGEVIIVFLPFHLNAKGLCNLLYQLNTESTPLPIVRVDGNGGVCMAPTTSLAGGAMAYTGPPRRTTNPHKIPTHLDHCQSHLSTHKTL